MSAPMLEQVKTSGICKTGSVLKGLSWITDSTNGVPKKCYPSSPIAYCAYLQVLDL
jgi:hypothetical protein